MYRGLSLHDEGSILTIADALRNGEVLYRDRVTALAPLTYELMARLLDWFGPSLGVGRVLALWVFSGCLVLLHRILLPLCGWRAALFAVLAMLAIKPLAFPLWTMVNYSQIALFFCLVSVWALARFLSERRAGWLLLAGLGIGLTILSKQNLGAILGLVAGLTVVADWLRQSRHAPRMLWRRAGLGLAGAAAPIVGTWLYFLARGAATDFLQMTLVSASHLGRLYWVPPPDLGFWALDPENLARRAFSFFPSTAMILGWDHRLDLSSPWVEIPIEGIVKLAYLIPLLAVLAGGVSTLRGFLSSESSSGPQTWLLMTLFGAGLYASMLYRADWAHLMNIYPALILLMVLAITDRARRSPFYRVTGVALGGVWLLAGLVGTWGVQAAYRVPVDTPRGRFFASSLRAAEVKNVLAYLARQPRDERIAVLRAEPLYYFLSGRRVPFALDLVMPGLVSEKADLRMARLLQQVDQVIYNPNETPLVPGVIPDYAPRTAAVLAGRFRVDARIAYTAWVLKPRPASALAPKMLTDLVERFEEGSSATPAIERTAWAMYRVIAVHPTPSASESCFSLPYAIGENEALEWRPLFAPSVGSESPGVGPSFVNFEIRIHAADSPIRVIPKQIRISALPLDPLRVSLAGLADRRAELGFCIRGRAQIPSTWPPLWAGWGELRTVRMAPERLSSARRKLSSGRFFARPRRAGRTEGQAD